MSEKEEKKGKINRQKIITAVSWIVCGFIFIYYFYLYSTSPGSFKTLLFSTDSVEKIDATPKSGIILTEARSLLGWSWFNRDRLSIDPDEFTVEKNSILSGTKVFTIPHSRVKRVTLNEGYICSTVTIVTGEGIFPDRDSFSIESKKGFEFVKASIRAVCNMSKDKFIIIENKSLLKRAAEKMK